jgi:hypothetical protein
LRALADRLLASGSATRTLTEWCIERGIGEGPVVAKRREQSAESRPDDEQLDALMLQPGERLRHRQVTLVRGGIGLSDCDLWWLPCRLPLEMARQVDLTARPYGAVIAPLAPSRRTLSEEVLPAGLPHVLEHRAVVFAGDSPKRPLAAVRELYRAVLIGDAVPERKPSCG